MASFVRSYELVAFGLFGVVTDHEQVTSGTVVDDDFFDLQVATDLVVAARPCEHYRSWRPMKWWK